MSFIITYVWLTKTSVGVIFRKLSVYVSLWSRILIRTDRDYGVPKYLFYWLKHILGTQIIFFVSSEFILFLSSDAVYKWRARVGSSWANSGGTVYALSSIINYPSFNLRTLDNDVAILRTASLIAFNNFIRPASIAGSNYQLADNQVVWSVGWGRPSVSIKD